MTTVVALDLGAAPDAWRRAGFVVDDGGAVVLGGIGIRLGGDDGSGLSRWTLADAPDTSVADIDGLRTSHARAAVAPAESVHPNGVSSIDHIVVNTPDLERTCAAIEAATGAPLRRIREVGQLRQGFHRLGELIIEVVTHPGITSPAAELWGLALNVVDIDAMFTTVGEATMSPPKDAVQPGRRIASFRVSAGLGVPVAIMTPHIRSTP